MESISLDKDSRRYSKEYNDRYLHWDDLEYRDFGSSTKNNVWALMKLIRSFDSKTIDLCGRRFTFNMTSDINRILYDIDRAVQTIDGDGKSRVMYGINSMMEESIASSQIEGASTDTDVAKKMLRNDSPPKNRSMKMIKNNYAAMRFIKDNVDKPLSLGLIKDVHRIISKDLMDDQSQEGEFRTDNSIAVRDVYEDITHHVPVDCEEIERALSSLCKYINDDSEFVHPIVKGIILHYLVAYIHPFFDGNGRTSRALFNWFVMRNGYDRMECIPVSKMIKKHRSRYNLAFLRAETDENDMTYFIQYNLDVIREAIDSFDEYREYREQESEDAFEVMDGLGLNLRQSEILNHLMRHGDSVSVQELSVKYNITQTTIRRDLLKLLDMGFVNLSGKDSYKQLYRYSGKTIKGEIRLD